MTDVANWNTYAEWGKAQCVARIAYLQEHVSASATAANGPNGGATFQAEEKVKLTIWELRCRLAEIRGTPRPPPPLRSDPRRGRVTFLRPRHDSGY